MAVSHCNIKSNVIQQFNSSSSRVGHWPTFFVETGYVGRHFRAPGFAMERTATKTEFNPFAVSPRTITPDSKEGRYGPNCKVVFARFLIP
jgi:hypothetical protein